MVWSELEWLRQLRKPEAKKQEGRSQYHANMEEYHMPVPGKPLGDTSRQLSDILLEIVSLHDSAVGSAVKRQYQ
jgi:hypothetical protein